MGEAKRRPPHPPSAATVLRISLDGELLFEWEGDRAAIERLHEALSEKCRTADLIPETVALACLRRIHRQGRWVSSSRAGKRGEMAYIAWLALQTRAENGVRVADYAGLENHVDVNFRIEEGPDGASWGAEIRGRTKSDS